MRDRYLDNLVDLLEKISCARLGADWMTKLELSNLEKVVKAKIRTMV